MGINLDDSLRLNKFIQQGTTTSRHRSLAQTFLLTPDMTVGRATLFFETSAPANLPPTESVNALFCRYCKSNDHKIQACPSKEKEILQKELRPSTPRSEFHLQKIILCDL